MRQIKVKIILATIFLLSFTLIQTVICMAGIAVIKLEKLENSEGIVRVTGTGYYSDHLEYSVGQKRMMAERAAVVDAYRKLLEQIGGVIVDSNTTIQDYIVKNDTIKLKVNGIVRGAKQVAVRHLDDGTTEVDLEIKLGKEFYDFCQPYISKSK